jgi:hypothetical protein
VSAIGAVAIRYGKSWVIGFKMSPTRAERELTSIQKSNSQLFIDPSS